MPMARLWEEILNKAVVSSMLFTGSSNVAQLLAVQLKGKVYHLEHKRKSESVRQVHIQIQTHAIPCLNLSKDC